MRPPLKAGLVAPPPVGQGVVVVGTRGRVSGERREVPLVAWRLGERVMVSTVRNDSQWLRNLEADPNGWLWVCGEMQPVTAEVHRGRGLNVAVLRQSSRETGTVSRR